MGCPALVRIKQSVLTMSLMIRDLPEYTRKRLARRIPTTSLAYDVGRVCEAAHDEVRAAQLAQNAAADTDYGPSRVRRGDDFVRSGLTRDDRALVF